MLVSVILALDTQNISVFAFLLHIVRIEKESIAFVHLGMKKPLIAGRLNYYLCVNNAIQIINDRYSHITSRLCHLPIQKPPQKILKIAVKSEIFY